MNYIKNNQFNKLELWADHFELLLILLFYRRPLRIGLVQNSFTSNFKI